MGEATELNPEGKQRYPAIVRPQLQTANKKEKLVKKNSFIKTPSFSEYVEHFQNGEGDRSVKPEVIFCFQQTRARQLLVIFILSLLFLLSASGAFILWFTNTFDATILSHLILRNNSQAYYEWKTPSVKPLLNVHIFNYTNVEDFQSGKAAKLKVEDLGPYVYEETMERVNTHFNGNGTVTFQEKRSYIFRPDLSLTSYQSDQVVVPNMPLIGAISMVRFSPSFARWGFNALLNGMVTKSFLTLPAHRFLWGYDDKLVTLAKQFLSFKVDMPYEKFGILAARNRTSREHITIYTGEDDINQLGTINQIDGQELSDYWSTHECNRIDGSDGAHFPINSVHNLEKIYVYNTDLCRKLPLEYTETILINLKGQLEMPAARYRIPKDVFARPDRVPENQCYCHLDSGFCPPEGVFNASPCAHGAPAFASFPHFYLGDQSLIDTYEGLNPDPEKHSSFIDVHPNLAFPIHGSSRFQINIQVNKASQVSYLNEFDDGTILPVVWLEVTLGELPDDIINILYHATISANWLKTILKYLCLVVVTITFSLLMMWYYAYYTSKLYHRRVLKQKQRNDLVGLDNFVDSQ